MPFFRRLETDADHGDDFHGTDGPIFVHHSNAESTGIRPSGPSTQACVAAGFPNTDDHNNPDAAGVGPGISNNHQGVRFSAALGYLDLARHRLNLTIRANCHVKRVIFEGSRAVGLEVESGGDSFAVSRRGDCPVRRRGGFAAPDAVVGCGT